MLLKLSASRISTGVHADEKNATFFSEETYFELNSSYSDSYSPEDDNSSQFMLFVAKVPVGS